MKILPNKVLQLTLGLWWVMPNLRIGANFENS